MCYSMWGVLQCHCAQSKKTLLFSSSRLCFGRRLIVEFLLLGDFSDLDGGFSFFSNSLMYRILQRSSSRLAVATISVKS